MTNQKEIEALIDEAFDRQKRGNQDAPWDCLALVGLTSINEGQYAAYLYKTALETTPAESRPLLWRRYVDALSEMLIVVGLPRTLNALYAMMPLVEKSDLTYLKKSDWEADTAARGWQYATLTHHDWADRYKEVALYAPDVAHITLNVSIEKLLSDYSVHDGLATMALLLTVLVTTNCPLQASWYVDGYLRHGGERETLHDIVEFAKKIAHDTGNELPASFPSVEEMLGGTTPYTKQK